MLFDILLTELANDNLLEEFCDGLCFCRQHGCLVHNANPLQMSGWIESIRMPAVKCREEFIRRAAAGNKLAEQFRLLHISDNDRWCAACAVGKRCSRFLMSRLSVNDHRVFFVPQLCGPVPNL